MIIYKFGDYVKIKKYDQILEGIIHNIIVRDSPDSRLGLYNYQIVALNTIILNRSNKIYKGQMYTYCTDFIMKPMKCPDYLK